MASKQGKTGLIVTIVVLALTLLVVGSIAIARNANQPAVTTESQPEVSNDQESVATDDEVPASTDADSTSKPTPAVDPETLASIAIEPLEITVFYTKGIPGFEFAVKRTTSSTEYVEFSAPELVGTKCTDDGGVFVSIIENPDSAEDTATISQKVTVGSNTYGLSLAGQNCASDTTLLQEYQTAFTNGFSQLKALE